MSTSTMNVQPVAPRVRWSWAVLGFVVLEAAMVAAAFAWVAIYSHALHPGGSHADYEAYAKVASPVVALVTGIPLFWAAGVVLRRRLGPSAVSTAIAIVALYLVVGALSFTLLAEDRWYNGIMFVANAVTKVAAVWFGVRGSLQPNGGTTGGGR